MLLLKTCPRCRGDLHLKYDINGSYLDCLQCGFIRELPAKPGVNSKGQAPKKEKARA